MNDRERLFLKAVIALVVLIVGFVVFNGVTAAFQSRQDRIGVLQREIKQNDQKVRLAKRDLLRLAGYKQRSLPSEAATAHSQFQEWLLGIAETHFAADSVNVQSAAEKVWRSKAREFSFVISSEGTLDQLTQFLHGVYSANSLHRIRSLSVTRKEASPKLKLSLVFEGLSLPNAELGMPAAAKLAAAISQNGTAGENAQRALPDNKLWLDAAAGAASHRVDEQLADLVVTAATNSIGQLFGPIGGVDIAVDTLTNGLLLDATFAKPSLRLRYPDRQLADYQNVILRRNLFGLANQPPNLAFVGPTTATTNSPFSLTLNGTDPDEFDNLQFTLEDEVPDGATLRPAGGKSAKLEWTPTTPGSYDFAVRVVDSGWPPESTLKRLQIRVEDPRPVEPPAAKPVFDLTAHTVLTATMQGGDGRLSVWLHERPTNIIHKKFEGDEFQVGTAKVVVKQIGSDEVRLEVNGELRDLKQNDRLDGGKAPRVVTQSSPMASTTNREPTPRAAPSSDPRPANSSTVAAATTDPVELEKNYPQVDPRYLKYYADLFATSDLNGNGTLEKDEWAEMRTDPAPADVDRNSIVTRHEFILWRAASNR